jgi:hypothetical protein
MGFLSKSIGKVVDGISGGAEAGKAARKGAETTATAYEEAAAIQAAGEQEGYDYLQERDALDYTGSQGAKSNLMGLYGLEGGTGSQQALIDQAQQSPLYAAIQGTRQAGEDAISRNASMTGGLRSGGIQANMYDFNQRLDERALLESYDQQVSGLEGISQWETNENNIYQAGLRPSATEALGIAQAGEARGLGRVAEGNAIQAGRGGILDAGATVLGGAKWSDLRLKDNVQFVDNIDGVNIYEWEWNDTARDLGLEGIDVGVMADEIEQFMPEAVGVSQGFKTVNYDMLGV